MYRYKMYQQLLDLKSSLLSLMHSKPKFNYQKLQNITTLPTKNFILSIIRVLCFDHDCKSLDKI